MNTNWPRWIKLSISKHFEGAVAPLQLYVEGISYPDDKPIERVELAIDGPDLVEHLRDEYTLRVYINLLLVTEPNPSDLMYHEKLFGTLMDACSRQISVNKYGNSAGDDPNSHIGCLYIDSGLRTTKFDGPRPITFYASSIDTEYKILL